MKKKTAIAKKPETVPAEVPKPIPEAPAPPPSPVEILLQQAEELYPKNPRAAKTLRDQARKMMEE